MRVPAGTTLDVHLTPRFAAERIPLLEEVLTLIGTARTPAGRASAVVEAKGPGTGGPLARALRYGDVRGTDAPAQPSATQALTSANVKVSRASSNGKAVSTTAAPK